MSVNKDPHYIGHRKRIKAKFLSVNSDTFSDYELLELLLFQSIPRKDVKPLAKELLQNFGDFKNLLNAGNQEISKINGTNENITISFKLIKELINRVLKQRIINKNAISSWSSLLDYLKFNMSNLKVEQFRVLFLNKRNILIADEIMSVGTIDQAPVYPREIIKRSLFYEAGAIILVHNHPGGVSKPSNSDITLTNKIVEACKTVNVTVHDHVIIGNEEFYSFKSNLLL
jgi:DNA repair protein RadC